MPKQGNWIMVDPIALPVVTATADTSEQDAAIVGRTVFTLTADIEVPHSDNYCEFIDGISAVHATLDGALAHLDQWLAQNGIDLGAAHYGETRHRDGSFVGNDPDPDTMDAGEIVHWGVNRTRVQA